PQMTETAPVSANAATWFAMRQQRRRRRNSAGGDVSVPMPEDFVMRLKANSLSGIAIGDPVSSWPDMSGNGYDATQSTVSMQPTMDVASWGGNSFRVVRFDTVDDGMETSLVLDAGSPFSIFALWRPTDFDVFCGALVASASRDWTVGNLNGAMLCYFEDWSGYAPVAAGAFYLIEVRVDPGASVLAIYLNGNGVGIEGGGCGGPDQVALGASGSNGYPGNCECAEVLIYDRFLSETEAQAVRDYFQAQYNYLDL
ncbi:MAG: hypothetical protein ACXWIU_06965, partial [Limisphaerales bacterium]